MRERGYVEVARLSGMSGPSIIFFELMPNLLPYLAATLVSAVSAAILASIGLEVLGLGPIDAPTLGMTLYWVNFNAAMINGWWWWWTAPTVIILTVFLGLFFLTVGLDEIANPRLRQKRVSEPVLRVEGLRVAFDHPLGQVQAVDDVSFALSPGERFGLAGESGSGKSTLALSILRMIKPPGRIEAGEVWLAGTRLGGSRRGRDAGAAPRRHRAGAAGLDELAQSGAAHRAADRRCLRRSRAAL